MEQPEIFTPAAYHELLASLQPVYGLTAGLTNKMVSKAVAQVLERCAPAQDYLPEKLQLLIDQKLIKGTFENGTEYTVVSTALNLSKDVLRLIQKIDF